jgi:hypothetical protein
MAAAFTEYGVHRLSVIPILMDSFLRRVFMRLVPVSLLTGVNFLPASPIATWNHRETTHISLSFCVLLLVATTRRRILANRTTFNAAA